MCNTRCTKGKKKERKKKKRRKKKEEKNQREQTTNITAELFSYSITEIHYAQPDQSHSLVRALIEDGEIV